MKSPLSARVVHVVPASCQPDGVTHFQRNLIARLIRFSQVLHPNLAFYTCGLRGAARSLKEMRCDIVHFNLPTVAWRFKFLLALHLLAIKWSNPSIRIVTTIHEWSCTHWLRRLVNIPVVFLSDAVVCPTDDVATEVGRWVVRDGRGIPFLRVIPIGPNLPIDNVGTLTSREGAPLTIGTFGFLYPAKHPLKLLDVVEEVKRRDIAVVLRVVGDFLPQMQLAKRGFHEAVRRRGIFEAIELYGHVPDVGECNRLLGECDVFLGFNSRGFTERNGSILACLNFGKAVVTSRYLGESPLPLWLQRCVAEGRLIFVDNDAVPSELADVVIAASERKFEPIQPILHEQWDRITESYVEIYRSLLDRM